MTHNVRNCHDHHAVCGADAQHAKHVGHVSGSSSPPVSYLHYWHIYTHTDRCCCSGSLAALLSPPAVELTPGPRAASVRVHRPFALDTPRQQPCRRWQLHAVGRMWPQQTRRGRLPPPACGPGSGSYRAPRRCGCPEQARSQPPPTAPALWPTRRPSRSSLQPSRQRQRQSLSLPLTQTKTLAPA